jgi:hypothetical protein
VCLFVSLPAAPPPEEAERTCVIDDACANTDSVHVFCCCLCLPPCSTFTEEAERTCKGDFLCDKLSISAAGLLYHFDKAPADYGYEKKDEYKEVRISDEIYTVPLPVI